jgi:DeoR family fructose operon transcriptional repressor
MFPEIVGRSCIDAAVLAYRAEDLPENIVTPFTLITRESLNEFYIDTQTGWELNWEHVYQQLELPKIWKRVQSSSELPILDCIGILIPFPEHEWYKNLMIAMKAYASKSKINIEVIDAEQNLKDELEFRKRKIARRAVQEISPGDVVIIDGGVVTEYLAEFIQELSDITVITNAAQIFKRLEENPNITLISTGGVLRRNSGSLVGPIAENFLRDVRADKLFLTVSGVSIDFGLSHTHVSDVTIKQAMINSARQVILLGEHTKFDQESFTQIAPINVVDILITDNGLPASSRLQLNKSGINVIIAHT